MNSLYTTYSLPPPPPPTSFSRDLSPSRARLPDLLALHPNDPSAQMNNLRSFLDVLFFWDTSHLPGLFIQLKVCAGIISFLVVLVIFIIAKRIGERAFWIVRFAHKSEGVIIIPNAVSCFTFMEGVYGVIVIAL